MISGGGGQWALGKRDLWRTAPAPAVSTDDVRAAALEIRRRASPASGGSADDPIMPLSSRQPRSGRWSPDPSSAAPILAGAPPSPMVVVSDDEASFHRRGRTHSVIDTPAPGWRGEPTFQIRRARVTGLGAWLVVALAGLLSPLLFFGVVYCTSLLSPETPVPSERSRLHTPEWTRTPLVAAITPRHVSPGAVHASANAPAPGKGTPGGRRPARRPH